MGKNMHGSYKSYKTDEWDSDLTVVRGDDITVLVHIDILSAMRAIGAEIHGVEYGLYAKGEWIDGVFVVGNEWYIPEQRVSAAKVDFEEDAPPGFNVVLHKHPRGVKRFSATDWKYINPNFEASILYEGGNFVDACVRVPNPSGGFILISARAETVVSPVEVSDEELGRITRAPIVVHGGYDYQKQGGWDEPSMWEKYMGVPFNAETDTDQGDDWKGVYDDDPAIVRAAIEAQQRAEGGDGDKDPAC